VKKKIKIGQYLAKHWQKFVGYFLGPRTCKMSRVSAHDHI